MKYYIARTQIALTLRLADGSKVHISFNPKTVGGSTYATDDARIQKALKAHSSYGGLFKEYIPEEVVAEQTTANETEAAEGAKKTIRVADLSEARNYVADRFGVSRTKLRSKQAILECAAEHNIVFEGIGEE